MREVTVGELVTVGGRVLRVRGFDPMSVENRQVELEDCKTGEQRKIAIAELVHGERDAGVVAA